jgi:hypothetical protein
MGEKRLSGHSTAEVVIEKVRIDIHRVLKSQRLATEEEKSVVSAQFH